MAWGVILESGVGALGVVVFDVSGDRRAGGDEVVKAVMCAVNAWAMRGVQSWAAVYEIDLGRSNHVFLMLKLPDAMLPTRQPFSDDMTWQECSYQDLMDEAVRLELQHAGEPDTAAGQVRARLEDMVMTCSFLLKPSYADFASFFRRMCSPRRMHPLTVESFLRAAWKGCEEDASGARPISGKAEIAERALKLGRSLVFDTEQSWAYEGLPVRFRAHVEEGEDPAALAGTGSQQLPLTMTLGELERGMRDYIESGGLEAKFSRTDEGASRDA